MLVVRTELEPIAGSPVLWSPEVPPAAEIGGAVRSTKAQARCDRLEGLLERHEASLYDFLYRLTGSGAEAGRLTRDALLRASLDAPTAFDGGAELEERRMAVRLFTVATAGVLGRGRLRALWGPLQRRLPRMRRAPITSATDAPDVPDLLSVLESLSAPQRACILLREHHELSYDEIAEVLGTGRGEVVTLLAGARDALRHRARRAEAYTAARPGWPGRKGGQLPA
ncbi:MAG TPA: RNA polymerase sigma factor [Chloroflexota bacterium]|nr:RNA polymerase sigma factor [Chloroflexota bacterium]